MDPQPINLDARDLKCPLPVLKARRALRDLVDGAILEVWATDPGAPADFRHFCTVTGHKLIAEWQEDGVFHFRIQKAVPAKPS